MRILVCDDEPTVMEYIAMILEPEGHQLEMAFDGQDALEKIQANPESFDLLITDNKMPRLTGVELLEKLRAQNIHVKVMMITGFVSQLSISSVHHQLFDRLLPKPFMAAELLNCLNDLIG